MKRKITVITGSRSEYGILKPVLKAISDSQKLELYLIVVGMHLSKKYGMTINEIKKDGFKISQTIKMTPKEDSNFFMSIELGKSIIEFSKIFRKIKPDINLVLGDRDEMLASALAASHMNIPNAHIHGGDKSMGGIDEYNRHAITKISNIHFPATPKSKARIIKMGESPKHVFLTGSPSIDEIISNNITTKKILEKKYGFSCLENNILLVQHPVTTESKLSGVHILSILKSIIKLKRNTIAIAPNSDAGNQKIFDYLTLFSKKYPFIKLYPNIPRNDFLAMLKNCGVVVGNSSSGMIEASYFNTPIVNIGIRQKDRERGSNVIDVEDVKIELIVKAITKALRMKKNKELKNCKIYGNGKSSNKIVRILEKIQLNNELIQKQIFY